MDPNAGFAWPNVLGEAPKSPAPVVGCVPNKLVLGCGVAPNPKEVLGACPNVGAAVVDPNRVLDVGIVLPNRPDVPAVPKAGCAKPVVGVFPNMDVWPNALPKPPVVVGCPNGLLNIIWGFVTTCYV